ncbi:MAG: biotin synthase BioB [Elusimicrobia bacterium]|nr:biotin synthase BioB [Elusimicrobiota bacterium]
MINLEDIYSKIINDNYRITETEARKIWSSDLSLLLETADKIRKHFKGNEIKLCSIINAKSGNCPENCKFCAQSLHNKAVIEKYPLVDQKKVEEAFESSKRNRASCFGIITSGKRVTEEEIDRICEMAQGLNGTKTDVSVSLGMLSTASLKKIKESGINKIHHNLETAESYFPSICTTHSYLDRLSTVKKAKEMGFEICSGGIFGIGELPEQRIELAFALRKLDVDSIPLNFLNPIKGTRLEKAKPLSQEEILRTIAIFRFILPDKDIKVCGGREVNLKDSQSKIFYAGANGMMVGGYLTTDGRPVEEDIKMIEDQGFTIQA